MMPSASKMLRHHEAGLDDARDAQWFPLSDLPHLAFDHEEIIGMAGRFYRKGFYKNTIEGR